MRLSPVFVAAIATGAAFCAAHPSQAQPLELQQPEPGVADLSAEGDSGESQASLDAASLPQTTSAATAPTAIVSSPVNAPDSASVPDPATPANAMIAFAGQTVLPELAEPGASLPQPEPAAKTPQAAQSRVPSTQAVSQKFAALTAQLGQRDNTHSAASAAQPILIPERQARTQRLEQATPTLVASSMLLAQNEPQPTIQLPLPGRRRQQEPPPTTPIPQTPPTEAAPPVTPQPSPAQPPGPGETPAPTTPEAAPPPPPEGQPADTSTEAEPRVLVAEVAVEGAEGTLQEEVYKAISTQPGRTATRSQLQADVNAIFATGFFSNVRVDPSDTPLGVRVTFIVQQNPILRQVQTTGTKVLPAGIVEQAFSPQYGQILNFRNLQEGIKTINKWYQDNGYVLAQVVGSPKVTDEGNVTLEIAEGTIEDIQVKYTTKEGEEVDAKGRPVKKKTKPYVILREVQLKPGDIFNRNTIQNDLQRVFGLGLFDDVKVALNPGSDPRRVIVVVNVAEKNTGSIAAGAGISSGSGLFGSVSFQQQNFRGRNQKIGAELQIGERDSFFDLSFTDPWIKGDPYRTSYTVNFFRRQSISLVYNGDDTDIRLPNDDRPRVNRLGGGITFTRPLNKKNPFIRPAWTASLGLQYQRVSIRDRDGDLSPRSSAEDGSELLSFSSSGIDDLTTVQFGVARDKRDNPTQPTKGSLFRIGTEQSIPVGSGSILFNRLRTSYSYYIPVRLLRFRKKGPQTLAFNVQGGAIVGDLPPYEAFALGGSNSVRGYGEGELGSGRYFIQGTAEYRFPLFGFIGGAVFVDAASNLGSGDLVPGDPSGKRDLPGTGFGGGLGLRINSPLGPIRIDYGINDQGDGRLHFGLGTRF